MQCRRKPYDYSKLRPNYPRTRTGCLSCRLRKKKCDEAKPVCQNCRRICRDCQWPDIPKAHAAAESIDSRAESPQQSSALTHSNVQRDETQPSALPMAFLSQSPTGDLSTPGMACTLTPLSVGLLRHYIEHTAGLLSTAPLAKCPFITIVLPLAYTDDLLMHTILALSGTHLECKQSRGSAGSIGDSGHEVQSATILHYQKTISGLRQELVDFDSADGQKQARILLILIMICHYEAISGNYTGMMLHHLCASRQLIERLLAQRQCGTVNREIVGLSLELYAYMTIINSLAFYQSSGKLTQPYDTVFLSLDELSCYSTFGIMFSGYHSLYEIIPQISQLGADCLAEEKALQDQWVPSLRLHSIYKAIEQRIVTRKVSPLEDAAAKQETGDFSRVAEIVRHSLYIYLMTSFCGTRRPDVDVQSRIQSHVNIVATLGPLVHDTRSRTILLWPCVIAGSCMIDEKQQQGLMYALLHSGFDMKHLFGLCEMLQRMWGNEDESSYGPYGLYMTMEKNSRYIPFM